MIASAVTIGSGGAAGREGPIALIPAGLGSLYARLAHRTEEERRLLLLAGMAAGLSAIFRSPSGTGVFAIQVLYGKMEFEVGVLLYKCRLSNPDCLMQRQVRQPVQVNGSWGAHSNCTSEEIA
jgi:H+/Cl- antiporter ClcA